MDEPDWSQLPNQPLQFFGLNESFDRKDLKRAYGRLIKIYKPETAPDEFQKIRAAYELLESWLERFNANPNSGILPPYPFSFFTNSPINQSFHGDDSEPASTADSETKNSPDQIPAEDSLPYEIENQTQETKRSESQKRPSLIVPPETVEQILQKNAPSEWYSALVEKAVKMPEDYVRLAFLSEMVDSLKRSLFLDWLCSGLKKYPRDPKLAHLIYHYCQNLTSEQDRSETLIALVHQLTVQQSFFLAENLWDHLLKRNFSEFRRLWDKFVEPHKVFEAPILVPFLTERLTAAVWLSEETWLQEQLRFIEENFELLQHHHEFQLSFYEMLSRFLVLRSALKKVHPHKAEPFEDWVIQLKKYCLAVNPEEREEFCRFQRKLAGNFEQWAHKFSVSDETHYQKMLARVWELASYQMRPTTSVWLKKPYDAQATLCIREWFIRQKQPFMSYQLTLLAAALFFVVSAFLSYNVFYIAGSLIAYLFSKEHFNSLTYKDIVENISIAAGVIVPLPLTHYFFTLFSKWKSEKEYLRSQRGAFALLLKRTRVTYRQFYDATNEWLSPENAHHKTHHLLLQKYISDDPALMIYRRALDYQI